MKKIKALVISGLIFFSGTFLTNAQAAISLSGTLASARIVAPLGFTLSGTLKFGSVAKPTNTSGTVVLNPKDELRYLTGVTNVGANGSNDDFDLPKYTVTGEVGLQFTLTLPSAVTINLEVQGASPDGGTTPGDWTTVTGDNADSMAITDFSSYTAADSDAVTSASRSGLVIGTTTANDYVVGATLTVTSDQKTGYYRGTYTVTAQYD